jgi:Protein of unknown function (DUF1064)
MPSRWAFRKKGVNKFHAHKTSVGGIVFASRVEARRWVELQQLEAAGEIRNLERQPAFYITVNGKQLKFPNGRRAKYTADFRYFDMRRNCDVIEDCKSKATRTEAYVLRKAIIEALYEVKIEEIH